MADFDDLSLLAKRKADGTDWMHIRKWVTCAKAMEQEDIDKEFFKLVRQYMSLSGLEKVPDHVALTDNVALWKLDSEFPSFHGKHYTRQYACPMRHLCGCMAGIRVTESVQGWMQMDICGCHD